MLLFIKGPVTTLQYFLVMLISTVFLVSLVAFAYYLPHDRNVVAAVMAILSTISIGSSAMVMHLTYDKKVQK